LTTKVWTIHVTQIAASEAAQATAMNVDAEVAKAMSLIQQLDQLATHTESLLSITRLFESVNARLFLKFEAVRPKKRIINRVCGGILTLGSHPLPIEIYSGPTARMHLKKSPAAEDAAEPGDPESDPLGAVPSVGKEKSIGNVNRSNWTPIELFASTVLDWPANIAQFVISM
jgi:hypothetical protein